MVLIIEYYVCVLYSFIMLQIHYWYISYVISLLSSHYLYVQ